jgi:hypothetical protein
MFLKFKNRVSGVVTLPTGAGASSFLVINANNINVWNTASPGAIPLATDRPYSYNTWLQFYDRFRVGGCKVRVKLFLDNPPQVNTGVNGGGVQAILIPVLQSIVIDGASVSEMPRARHRMYPFYYAQKACSIGGYASTAQIVGVSKETARTNGEFTGQLAPAAGTAGANPSLQWYWILVLQHPTPALAIGGAATGPVIRYTIMTTHYTQLYGRKWLTESFGPA